MPLCKTLLNFFIVELLFLGKILQDENKSLQSYGIENNTTVYLLKKLDGENVKGIVLNL